MGLLEYLMMTINVYMILIYSLKYDGICCMIIILRVWHYNNTIDKNRKMSQSNASNTINLSNLADESKRRQQQHKQRMMPLVRFLKKHGLKFKHAVCMGVRIEYFRMDSFNQLLQDKQLQLSKDSKLLELSNTVKDELVFFKRVQNSQKLKYPQNLIPTKTNTGKFASFRFDTTESKRIYFIVVLALIVVGVMFPLWPYEVKYWLWVLSVALLVVIVTLILVRLVVYIVLASFGISFWIFPNLFGDYGVIQSLKPFYSIQRWQNDVFNIVLRVISFGLFAYYCHSIYTEPEFYLDNFQSAKEVVKDVHDWGVNKIKGQAGNFSQRALTMDKIMNQTADAFEEEKKDHYTSFQEPEEVRQNQDHEEQEVTQQEGHADKEHKQIDTQL